MPVVPTVTGRQVESRGINPGISGSQSAKTLPMHWAQLALGDRLVWSGQTAR